MIEFGYTAKVPIVLNEYESMLSIDEMILSHIKKNTKITIADLAVKTGASESTIEKYIRKLKHENRLQRVGSKKSGIWEINQ